MNEKSRHYPLIPDEERKCIWMTTGFISYKLCDRDFLCESCPLEQAIKNDEGGGPCGPEPDEREEGARCDAPSPRIGGAVFYHPGHCWVKVESPESATIGLGDLVTQLLGDVRVAVLPRVGSMTRAGECCAHIIQADHILPVVAPLSGAVREVNPRLAAEPALLACDPKGAGWLWSVRPSNLDGELSGLLFGKRALAWHRRKERELVALTGSVLGQPPDAVGPTMQDGGVRPGGLREMARLANPGQRARILDSSLSRGGGFDGP